MELDARDRRVVAPDRDREAQSDAASEHAQRIEADTERFDQVATSVLTVGLAPLVAGWALYALVHYPHTSWYSWAITMHCIAGGPAGIFQRQPDVCANRNATADAAAEATSDVKDGTHYRTH